MPEGRPRLADIRAALRHTLPPRDDEVDGRAAAVAAVFRERDGELELLFIRRSRRRGDPWSGHMAWPGGKREAGDATMLACAVRETREEVDLDLALHGELIGSLETLRFGSTRRTGLRAVFAFVFAVTGAPGLRPSDEVQEAVWIPFAYFVEWKSRRPWKALAAWLPAVPPAFRYERRLIWGLTQWLLADLLARLAARRAIP